MNLDCLRSLTAPNHTYIERLQCAQVTEGQEIKITAALLIKPQYCNPLLRPCEPHCGP
jgi:hypothetical protein